MSKLVHTYLLVYYAPRQKRYYYELERIKPSRQVGESNGYGHEVVTIICLDELFYREKYRYRRKLYCKFYHFFDNKLKKLDEKEKKYHDKYEYHT